MNSILTKNKAPPNLVLTALLSSGLTIVVSLIYIVLSILALVYRNQCDIGTSSVDASEYFWNLIYRVYIQNEECGQVLPVNDITHQHTVFVFVVLVLCFSVLTLLASILLVSTVNVEEMYPYTNIFVFTYIAAWVAALAVDVTFAAHLGLDYTTLSQQLAGGAHNSVIDFVRQGAFILLAISLKGYATYAINMLLIVFLIKYACDYQDMSNTEEHPIHKLGALNAFSADSQTRRNTWLRRDREQPFSNPALRGQVNNAYKNDDEPTNSVRNNYPVVVDRSASFNRSDSWQRQPSPAPQPQIPMGSRPFSYLEEIRRPVPVNPPSTPTVESGWRRDPWPPAPPPPVPAPDYSPHGPRRLKSALKPAYM